MCAIAFLFLSHADAVECLLEQPVHQPLLVDLADDPLASRTRFSSVPGLREYLRCSRAFSNERWWR